MPAVETQREKTMNHDEYMTGAELQTLREACGLSRDTLGVICGVQARTVKHWEGGRSGVPDDVAQAVRQVARYVAVESAALAADIEREAVAGVVPVVLVRYREASEMPAKLRAAGLLPEVHGAMLARAACWRLVGLQDFAPRVVWFEPANYFEWLDTAGHKPSDDSEQLRSRWATLRALPAQAMPPRGDQPPA
jgi:DNA-binding XRE family transcriptional regulator